MAMYQAASNVWLPKEGRNCRRLASRLRAIDLYAQPVTVVEPRWSEGT